MTNYQQIRIATATVLLGVGLLLGGCGDSDTDATDETMSPSAEASASPGPTDEPGPTEAGGAGASATAVQPDGTGCVADQLEAAIEDETGGGAAGSVVRRLVVTNTDTEACSVTGYPGVSYVDADGEQVGAPADRDENAVTALVSLEPGESAVAQLRQTNAQNYGDECEVTDVAGVRVYPPNDTAWLIAPQTTVGCASEEIVLMTVGTFEPD